MTTTEPDEELVSALRVRAEQHGEELATALADLAGMLLDDEPLEAALQRVAELAVQAMPGCSAAGVTLLRGDRWVTAAATDELTLAVDEQQYAAGDGPCLDAARERQVNRVDLDGAEQRWPDFADAARALGVRSFLAAPLVVRDRSLGSLNLYSRERDGFDALDDALVGLFCAQASVTVANADAHARVVTLADQLEAALESRAVIEQAKGVLMARHGVDADTAFALLRERSQITNRKLRAIAQDVIAER